MTSPPSDPQRAAALARRNAQLLDAAERVDRSPEAALAAARRIAEEDPRCAEALRIAGAALRRLNRPEEAGATERAAIAAAATRDLLVQARAALDAKEFEAGERAVRAYLRRDAAEPGAYHMLAEVAAHFGYFAEAEPLLHRALALAPGYAAARVDLAKTRHRLGDADRALAELDLALAEVPGDLIALSFKAGLLTQLRRLDEALAVFETLIAAHPDHARGWMNYAYLLKTVGRAGDAVAAYRRSAALDPLVGDAWWGLANLKTYRFDDADVAAMQAALPRMAGEDDRVRTQFALGKAFADRRDYAESFAHYAAGNALRRAAHPYDPEVVTADVRATVRLCDRDFFAARAGSGDTRPDAIFILGMPRSGSTLVEQILASHSMVEGTEELFDIQRIAATLAREAREAAGDGAGHYLDRFAQLPSERLAALGAEYLETTRVHRHSDRPFFTDKMPGNWPYIGLIHAILPNARIIDVRRDPMDCGFANFIQHFHWGINFSYGLDDIGRYYRDYVRLMRHYDAVLPGRVHRVIHERLIDDFESEVRALLDHCGLPFEPACLHFHETRRAVHTPSAEQVRKPINRDGQGRWRHYAQWLGPLEAALGPVLASYPEAPDDPIPAA